MVVVVGEVVVVFVVAVVAAVKYIFEIPLFSRHIFRTGGLLPVRVVVRKERRSFLLFNDALNTFYFTIIWHRTYGIEQLV